MKRESDVGTIGRLALALCFLLGPQIPVQAQDSLYIKEHYTKSEFMITMRDGVKLFTSVYAPKDTTRDYPIILNRTSYSVGPYGLSSTRNRMVPSINEVREGYIFAYQDVRGRFLSEGTFVDLRPYQTTKKSNKDIDETTDTYDTVEPIRISSTVSRRAISPSFSKTTDS